MDFSWKNIFLETFGCFNQNYRFIDFPICFACFKPKRSEFVHFVDTSLTIFSSWRSLCITLIFTPRFFPCNYPTLRLFVPTSTPDWAVSRPIPFSLDLFVYVYHVPTPLTSRSRGPKSHFTTFFLTAYRKWVWCPNCDARTHLTVFCEHPLAPYSLTLVRQRLV